MNVVGVFFFVLRMAAIFVLIVFLASAYASHVKILGESDMARTNFEIYNLLANSPLTEKSVFKTEKLNEYDKKNIEPFVHSCNYGYYAEIKLLSGLDVSGVVQIASQQIGKEYEDGASGPDKFDCSGLVYYSYKENNFPITRKSAHQYYEQLKDTNPEPKNIDSFQPGDLCFFDWDNDGVIDHVGIFKEKSFFNQITTIEALKECEGFEIIGHDCGVVERTRSMENDFVGCYHYSILADKTFGYLPEAGVISKAVRKYPIAVKDSSNVISPATMILTLYDTWLTRITCAMEYAYTYGSAKLPINTDFLNSIYYDPSRGLGIRRNSDNPGEICVDVDIKLGTYKTDCRDMNVIPYDIAINFEKPVATGDVYTLNVVYDSSNKKITIR